MWVLQAAQTHLPGWTERDICEEDFVPGSPKSDSEWELLPDATVPSDCGSSIEYVTAPYCGTNDLAMLWLWHIIHSMLAGRYLLTALPTIPVLP